MEKIEEKTYIEAKKELEEIVQSIEQQELDVDTLTEKMKRASVLIALCKEKLTKTDEELKKLLEEIS